MKYALTVENEQGKHEIEVTPRGIKGGRYLLQKLPEIEEKYENTEVDILAKVLYGVCEQIVADPEKASKYRELVDILAGGKYSVRVEPDRNRIYLTPEK